MKNKEKTQGATASKPCDYELNMHLRVLSAKANKFALLGLIFLVITITGFLFGMWQVAIFMLIVAIICFSLWAVNKGKIKKFVSDNVTLGVLKSMFELPEYFHDKYIDEALLREAGLDIDWNKSSGNDYFRAKYRGVSFTYSDVKLIKEEITQGANGNESRNDVTVFKGQWLIINLNKEVKPPLFVSELKVRVFKKSQANVQTENEEFNKKFNIKTDDESTAFNILTPRFMEFILTAEEIIKGKKHLCFKGSQVFIVIETGKDSLEPGREAKDVMQLRARIQDEMAYIKSIIDELLLNKHLFDPL